MSQKRKPGASKKRPPRDAPAAVRPLAAMKRNLCGVLKLWRSCGNPACRRAHDCSGDPEACFAEHWKTESEDGKVWFREFIKACGRGLSGREAIQAAEDELARYQEWTARMDAQAAERAAQGGAVTNPAQAAPQNPPAAPRVRHV